MLMFRLRNCLTPTTSRYDSAARQLKSPLNTPPPPKKNVLMKILLSLSIQSCMCEMNWFLAIEHNKAGCHQHLIEGLSVCLTMGQ